MGLDIVAYSKIKKVDLEYNEEEGTPDGHIYIHEGLADWFPDRWPDLKVGEMYECEGDSHGFRAGSYSGYNEWRDQLAKMAGYASAEAVHTDNLTGAFSELINFADNEGWISWTIAKKLHKDFVDNAAKAKTFAKEMGDKDDRQWFLEKYKDWTLAFKLAADNGVVVFC